MAASERNLWSVSSLLLRSSSFSLSSTPPNYREEGREGRGGRGGRGEGGKGGREVVSSIVNVFCKATIKTSGAKLDSMKLYTRVQDTPLDMPN